MADPIIHTLAEPLEAHGETLTTLTVNPPTGKDIRWAGVPYQVVLDGDDAPTQKAQFDGAVVHRLICRCCNIPPSAVDKLGAADFNLVMGHVLGFFGVSVPKSKPGTTTPPGSGATSITS